MEKQQFKAESKRLLDLMINSIYTHQEIFLREIISNASDAMDKLAYLSLTDQNVGLSRERLRHPHHGGRGGAAADGVRQRHRHEPGGDGGEPGHHRQERLPPVQEGHGDSQEDIDIIGQFGVGFYSAFMVADAVTVISRKYGSDEAWMWQSSGADGYTVTACEKDAAGTDVIMHLKADTDDEKYSRFLQEHELRAW